MKTYTAILVLPLLLLNANAQEKKNKADPEVIKRGEAIYNRTCIACHQANGKGIAPAFPPLDGSDWLSDATINIKIILNGLQGPIKVNGTEFNGMMPPVMPPLNDQEIADVLTYVKQAWSNDYPAVTPELVKKVRKETADRKTPYTAAELGK